MKWQDCPCYQPENWNMPFNRMGFKLIRQKGSHMFFEHPDGRTTLVPNHPGEKIDRGLLNKIVKHDLKMSREEFLKYI
ncbi:MAG: type II toxin-antitoxin system HicA family toxin [Euryarchaeota archaeon]|nr:type II toxin-antitoxin system HicA family toxin [Euryarchaeota archaeon]